MQIIKSWFYCNLLQTFKFTFYEIRKHSCTSRIAHQNKNSQQLYSSVLVSKNTNSNHLYSYSTENLAKKVLKFTIFTVRKYRCHFVLLFSLPPLLFPSFLTCIRGLDLLYFKELRNGDFRFQGRLFVFIHTILIMYIRFFNKSMPNKQILHN